MKMTRFLTNTIGTAMLAGALMLAPQAAQARVFVSVGFAPPAIPVYVQPVCPGDGYIWTPGYWAYTDDGYEWVDGAWVLAPYSGALWTPGYWAYGPGGYFWNAGYWGPVVGYYGGINYGFGYFGVGFYGGYWNGGHFFYNRAYNRIGFGGGFHNVYENRVSGFDGRPGGASFARAANDANRGGTFNNAGARGFSGDANRGGSGEIAVHNNIRFAQSTEARSGNFTGGAGGYSIAQNRTSFQQPSYNQARPGNSINGGSSGANIRPEAPTNNFHPSQGSNFGGSQQRIAPAPNVQSGGGFHGGGGGGGSHFGRR